MRNRRTISLDLRERILETYDNQGVSRQEVAKRFCVSLGMVKKLISQRSKRGEIAPQHHRSGRKARIDEAQRRQIRALLASKPDMTLVELRDALRLGCTFQAVHVVLVKMGLTYKKRRCEPANKTVLTSPRRARRGLAFKASSTRRG